MKLAVISSSPIVKNIDKLYAYSPYERELEIWAKYSDEIYFSCPVWVEDKGLLITEFPFRVNEIFETKSFNIKSLKNIIKAVSFSFFNFRQIYKAMKVADHIHLRCPGNIGLMGCILQIFFPSKPKTAKYAGNWDMNAKQPLSYKIQKWILNNTFLTRNIKVLVYGEWENTSKNIKPFFTASYSESEKEPVVERSFENEIRFMFVGTLSNGKQPLYAVKMIEQLIKFNSKISLSIFGNGLEKQNVLDYIEEKKLTSNVFFIGNKPQEEIKKEYQKNHFVILPSLSEGWPKVVAEGMFWGCLPIATRVSCVPNMLANEERGLLLELDLEKDVKKINTLLLDFDEYKKKVANAVEWSRKYTLDSFENEIKKLLNK
ncbi:MAG TPA: glycosyltransferase [Flavobacterium lutivivi]|nr:glycosyltransferase [Flavobacterium lutivivi]